MNPLRGITLKIASVCVFVAMASLIKATSDHVPPGQAVFFRSFFALPVIIAWLWMRHELSTGLRTVSPLGHVWRGVVGTSAMGLGFAGLGLLPLPEVTAIGYAAPILVVVFATMFLGEDVRLFRLSMVALGMVGVVIVLSPRISLGGADTTHAEALGAMIVLMSAVCAAFAQVFVRKMVATETTSAIVFWFSITATLMSLLTLPWGWTIPAPREALLLILAGILGGVGQILLTSSYREADASLIAPFEYSSMLLALAAGYIIFDEIPSTTMLVGAAIIITAGMAMILRDRQLGIERARELKDMSPQG